ncbi:hypothetical protein CKQ70_30015 [Bacillus toyonensis]|nr:hypothetical protein CKQ70_30015 [Bacillus toyonensis]PAW43813.1 hypothetical protein CKQ69_30470 [Bacillus toyonensis]
MYYYIHEPYYFVPRSESIQHYLWNNQETTSNAQFSEYYPQSPIRTHSFYPSYYPGHYQYHHNEWIYGDIDNGYTGTTVNDINNSEIYRQYLITSPEYYQHLEPYFNSTNLIYQDPYQYQQETGTEWFPTIYHNEPGLRPTTEKKMKLLLDQTFTYGWSHSGVQSWGANWGVNAVNQASEQIRDSIARMVNLKQLETFTKKNIKSALDVESIQDKTSSSIKIGWKQAKSSTEQMNWVNQNNFLIDVSDVKIVPGTMWSKTEKDWLGRRKWNASATMEYRLRIWGIA